jgi:hypothetical protein
LSPLDFFGGFLSLSKEIGEQTLSRAKLNSLLHPPGNRIIPPNTGPEPVKQSKGLGLQTLPLTSPGQLKE